MSLTGEAELCSGQVHLLSEFHTKTFRPLYTWENWWGARVRVVWGGRKKRGWSVSWTTSELSASAPTSGQLQPRTGEMAQKCEQGAEHFMAKWIAAEKTRAGLRHAVVCPNMTGRTKERIAQIKRARAGSLALVD